MRKREQQKQILMGHETAPYRNDSSGRRLEQGETTMHKRFSSNASTVVVSMSLALFAAFPAEARIECRGNFQITKRGPISTPYCEEKQIARVARSYGIAVTDAEVRNNPNTKVWLCQTIGGDNRLKGSCAGYANPRGFPW
jgi:hypothetical protein